MGIRKQAIFEEYRIQKCGYNRPSHFEVGREAWDNKADPRYSEQEEYLGIEEKLERLAEEAGITLAELDLYLWYMETGKILK